MFSRGLSGRQDFLIGEMRRPVSVLLIPRYHLGFIKAPTSADNC
jgi:hypothetical protein